MSRKFFTLVELLTVIAIIAILAAIAVPATIAVYKSAYKATASSEIAAIKLGMENYMTNYNQSLPYSLMTNAPSGDSYRIVKLDGTHGNQVSDEYKVFMESMAGLYSGGDNDIKKVNPRKIEFLKPREKETTTDSGTTHAQWIWLDPWDTPYRIIFAAPGERKVTINGDDYYGKIFISSAGPDSRFDTGDDINSWD